MIVYLLIYLFILIDGILLSGHTLFFQWNSCIWMDYIYVLYEWILWM